MRRRNIAIEQVALAPLVARYLAYMRAAASLNVNLDIEWVHMAATLIQWKSRSLLPADPLNTPVADPIRDELVQMLSAHRQQVARDLARRQLVEGVRFSREPEKIAEVSDHPFLSVWDLMQQARELARWASEHRQDRLRWNQMVGVEQDDVSIGEMIVYLHTLFGTTGAVALDGLRLLSEQTSVSRRSYLLLAILELARNRQIQIQSDGTLGSDLASNGQVVIAAGVRVSACERKLVHLPTIRRAVVLPREGDVSVGACPLRRRGQPR